MRATMQPSNWGSRVGAFLIDVVCACVFGLAAYVLVVVLTVGVGMDGSSPGNEAEWAVIAFLSAVVNYSPLLAARKGKRSGQTLGRQAVGIRVVLADGRKLPFGRALSRHLAHLVIACVPVVGLMNHLWPLWDRRNQTLHDKLAGTVMVGAGYAPANEGTLVAAPGSPTAEPAGRANWA